MSTEIKNRKKQLAETVQERRVTTCAPVTDRRHIKIDALMKEAFTRFIYAHKSENAYASYDAKQLHNGE